MAYGRIRDIREDHDLTQAKMAKIIGISASTYSKWDSDEEIIPSEHLNTFCNYFNISMDYASKFTKVRQIPITSKKLNKELIGRRLKTFRKHFNLTQEKLASELNTSHSTISAYETGKTKMITRVAYEISKKYKVSMDYLYGRSDEMLIKEYNK